MNAYQITRIRLDGSRDVPFTMSKKSLDDHPDEMAAKILNTVSDSIPSNACNPIVDFDMIETQDDFFNRFL